MARPLVDAAPRDGAATGEAAVATPGSNATGEPNGPTALPRPARRTAGEIAVAVVLRDDTVAALLSLEVLNVAVVTPLTVFSVPVPSFVVPSRKVTVPVGVPAPGADTLIVTVNVTFWPDVDGLAEELSVVVVAALATGTTTAGLVWLAL